MLGFIFVYGFDSHPLAEGVDHHEHRWPVVREKQIRLILLFRFLAYPCVVFGGAFLVVVVLSSPTLDVRLFDLWVPELRQS